MKLNEVFRRPPLYHKHLISPFFHCEQLVLAMPDQSDVVGGCIGWSKGDDVWIIPACWVQQWKHHETKITPTGDVAFWSRPCHYCIYSPYQQCLFCCKCGGTRRKRIEDRFVNRMWHGDVAATQWCTLLLAYSQCRGKKGQKAAGGEAEWLLWFTVWWLAEQDGTLPISLHQGWCWICKCFHAWCSRVAKVLWSEPP